MKSIKIKGKDYVMVHERIAYFRSAEEYKGWSMVSEIKYHANDEIIIEAVIHNADEKVIASGLAHEKANSSQINKTSYIENCETSAWGRALANLGIGIESSIASAEEVSNAIKQQDDKPALVPGSEKWQEAVKFLKEGGKLSDIQKKYAITDIDCKTLQFESHSTME